MYPSSSPPAKKRRYSLSVRGRLSDSDLGNPSSPHTDTKNSADPINTDSENSTSGFDRGTFKAIVGEKLSIDALRRLEDVSGGNLERAINMYFDGSWKTAARAPAPVTNHFKKRKESHAESGPADGTRNVVDSSVNKTPQVIPSRIYLGQFGAAGWATRTGLGLVSYNDEVTIERQKMRSGEAIRKLVGKSKGKGGTKDDTTATTGRSALIKARKTQDIVVRFTNPRGEEVGRLPQETAAFVSTLIDQDLQLRCFMLKEAFENSSFRPSDTNRVADIFSATETDDERVLRLRQVALVKLFQETNLGSASTNAVMQKHKAAGILQAAEIAEQYEVAKVTSANEAGDEENLGGGEGKELEQDQLDALYQKAQSFNYDTPEAQPAETFAMDLRQYQKQALHWFLSKEKSTSDHGNESIHPLWEEYLWPTRDEKDKEVIRALGQDRFYVNPYSGELSLKFPKQEQNCLGGILADEMGLGKTIEMLSLIHTHRPKIPEPGLSPTNTLSKLQMPSNEVEPAPFTTLVVAPMSLLAQWESEAAAASKPGTLKSLVYYGSEKKQFLQGLCGVANAANAPGLIITSYGTVLSEFNQLVALGGRRGAHGGLFSINFFRVILDEGHHIKNRTSKTAKACYELNADHRWVLTGTPIVNRLEDLFSLVRFLRVEPWSNFSFWKTFITAPFEAKDFLRALDVVQTVLEPLVLRRTKDMKTPDGQPLVPLPKKTVYIEKIQFSKAEQDVYNYIKARAMSNFARNVEMGTILKSYTSMLVQILRLRQACCHPTLIRKKEIVDDELEAEAAYDAAKGFSDDMDLNALIDRYSDQENEACPNAYGAYALKEIRDNAGSECPICLSDPIQYQTVTGCLHGACKNCWVELIEIAKAKHELPKCVTCREPINERDLFEVIRSDSAIEDDSQLENSQPEISLRRINSRSSAKIEALIEKLKEIEKSQPGTKSCVFSQFTTFLDLIEPELKRQQIKFLRFDGSMQQQQRAAVVKSFKMHEGAIVLLLSVRSGGVGLNLTEARRVFIMDPWWSFAIESQAIDRVHRMGQTSEVIVHRFVVEGSVEEKMVHTIQARKKFIASSLGMMNNEEKKQARIDDIRILLSK